MVSTLGTTQVTLAPGGLSSRPDHDRRRRLRAAGIASARCCGNVGDECSRAKLSNGQPDDPGHSVCQRFIQPRRVKRSRSAGMVTVYPDGSTTARKCRRFVLGNHRRRERPDPSVPGRIRRLTDPDDPRLPDDRPFHGGNHAAGERGTACPRIGHGPGAIADQCGNQQRDRDGEHRNQRAAEYTTTTTATTTAAGRCRWPRSHVGATLLDITRCRRPSC